jgi:hypothetical protein
MRAFCYIAGVVITALSLSRIFIHKEFIYIPLAIIGFCIGVYGRLGLKD